MKFIAFATCLIGLTTTARLIECCSSTPMDPPTDAPTDLPTDTATTNLSCKTDKANVNIFDCKDLPKKFSDLTISAQAANLLKNKGYSKCVLPFGILVVGKNTFEDSGILTTAKIVAELIDQDRDGRLNIHKILMFFQFFLFINIDFNIFRSSRCP